MLDSQLAPTRRFGAIPDHDHVVDRDLVHSPLVRLPGLVVGTVPQDLSYASKLDFVPDQLSTSSCVGNSLSTSIYLRAKIAGHEIARPSRLLIYGIARLIDDPHLKMQDGGCRPTVAIQGTQLYGLCAETRWPFDERKVLEEPPQDVFQHALDAKVESYYRIAPGAGCASGIRRALASGYVPVFTMPVDEAYMGYRGEGVYGGMTGSSQGLHAQAIIGYGPGYLLVCNSWSDQWGSHGLVPIADAWFDSGQVSDILVPTVVPGGVT